VVYLEMVRAEAFGVMCGWWLLGGRFSCSFFV
jgi:hypothetical protein